MLDIAMQPDPLKKTRVQLMSMEYEQKNGLPITPRNNVLTSPRDMSDSPPDVNSFMNELNSKLKARKEKTDACSSVACSSACYEAEIFSMQEISSGQPNVLMKRLFDQIRILSEFPVEKDERNHFQSHLNQLSDLVTSLQDTYEKRFEEIDAAQGVPFVETFIEKSDELMKLQWEVANLNKLKKITNPQLMSELNAAKEEVQRLNDIIQQRSNEINGLMNELCDAKSYTESLEKSMEYSQSHESFELHPSLQQASEHFKTIKEALIANRTLLQTIQLRTQSN